MSDMEVSAAWPGLPTAAAAPWLRVMVLGFVAALALVACSALAPPPALARGVCAGESSPVSSTAPSALRASVLCLVNVTRLEHGLPALHQDPRLELTAQQHTDDMVTSHYFAHNSQDGRTPDQRVTAAGYGWAQTGENIAQGQSTPAAVVEGWMDEIGNVGPPGHCTNILEPGYRDLGVGVNPGAALLAYSPGTWTQDFGRLSVDPAASTDTGPQAGCPYSLPVISSGPVPTASGSAATAITQTSATLNGAVAANGGGFTSYHVQYGTTSGYGAQTLERAAGTASATVTEPLAGLAPGTTYHFRVVAMNKNGETDSADDTFSTVSGPFPPAASTAAATGVTQTAATLNGSVNPNGLPTSYHFDYGTTTSYGSTTPAASAGSGTTTQPVSANLPGLTPGTTYHYRLVATNTDGAPLGTDTTLTTDSPPTPTPPTVSTATATGVTQTAATLNGSVNPNGLPTSYHFDYGTTTSYGSTTPAASAGTGTTTQPVSANLSGLTPGTTYHYRLVATNTDGAPLGTDNTLTTDSPAAAGIDDTAPAATLSGTRTQTLGKTVRVTISCPDEACLVHASGTVLVPRVGARRAKLYKLKKVAALIARGGKAKLSPPLSGAARNAIRRALHHGRRITVKLKVMVADAAQNTRTLTRQIKLRL